MKINNYSIKKSIKYLKNNECIGIPTETVYGLAGNAYSDDAIDEIYRLKKRPKRNPLIVQDEEERKAAQEVINKTPQAVIDSINT